MRPKKPCLQKNKILFATIAFSSKSTFFRMDPVQSVCISQKQNNITNGQQNALTILAFWKGGKSLLSIHHDKSFRRYVYCNSRLQKQHKKAHFDLTRSPLFFLSISSFFLSHRALDNVVLLLWLLCSFLYPTTRRHSDLSPLVGHDGTIGHQFRSELGPLVD